MVCRCLTVMSRVSILSLALFSALSISCGSTSTETSVGPSPVRCGVTVTTSPSAFPAAGGSGNLVVAAARECAWNASTQADWISLGRPREGQGDGSVRYTVAANPTARTRTGSLAVGSQSAQITQQPAPCRFEVGRRTVDVSAAGGLEEVPVSAPDGCEWRASSSAAWITIVDGATGNGNGRVRLQVAANSAPTARSGSLQIAGITVTVRQSSPSGTPPPPSPGECSYAVDPESADIGAAQSDGTLSVQTDVGCPWTAVSDASWLSIIDGSTGSGQGQVRYRAAENSGNSSRTARIEVNGAVFTLTQAGRQSPVCNYDISPASASFPSDGGSGRIDVSTGNACPWTASTSASWIDITSGSADVGNGRVEYTVSANTSSSSRTGTIEVAGRTFTVSQDGAPSSDPVTVTGRIRNLSGSCPDRRFVVDGRDVRTTSDTDYDDGSCGDLGSNTFVVVTGLVGSDGVIRATEVDF
jgi:hypothetical protein